MTMRKHNDVLTTLMHQYANNNDDIVDWQVDMKNRTMDVDLSNYVENGEWELLSIRVSIFTFLGVFTETKVRQTSPSADND